MSRARLRAVSIAVALGLSACTQGGGAGVGDAASEIAALTLEGEPVRLEDYRGKVVLINFWSGGCGPCLAEMPQLEALYLGERDRGFEVLGLNSGDSQADVAGIDRRFRLSFPLLVDSLEISASRYEVIGVPTSFLVGRDGTIVAKFIGPLDGEALTARLDELL